MDASSYSDTIFALSTPGGKSAIAVVRVSGPCAGEVLRRVCGHHSFEERRATVKRIYDENGELLDRAVVIAFRAPRSFTGEDQVEFQVTGGRAIISALLRAISACPNTRPAYAGEFARRAFANGKLDPGEVEGIAALAEAETRAELRSALSMASGEVSRCSEAVRGLLLTAMGRLEALLDFSDVEDARALNPRDIEPLISEAVNRLSGLLRYPELSERLRTGMTIVIAGPPNAGKSTLLNALVRRRAALVSPIAGTTRDAIEVPMELAGYPVMLIDTAGLRETSDTVEAQGVELAIQKARSADLVLWLSDGLDGESVPNEWSAPLLRVRTKCDLQDAATDVAPSIAISAQTGYGLDQLTSAMGDEARRHFEGSGEVVLATERQRAAARDAMDALQRILEEPERLPEVTAEDLRSAADAMARISGRIGVDEVLGEVFSRMCVGK